MRMTEEEFKSAIEAERAKTAEVEKKYNDTMSELTKANESLKTAIKERDEANALFLQSEKEKIKKNNIMEDLK